MGNRTSRDTSNINMAEVTEFVKTENEKHKVVIWSKSYCPYCSRTKNVFQSMGVYAKVYELDEMSNGDAIQGVLASISGQHTVPNVYIKGQHIGGNDNVQRAASSGKLKELLA
mmetsp:Transcript_25598/g.36074  ORF Transcript_25598/g.36074 Transcript_25598/m.36074 type:complete len:113 (+) Transcript_25598:159-497(+)